MITKNVPPWERLVRGGVGGAALVAGVWWAVAAQPWWGALVAASGASLLATALTGWCPACAMVGRTLPQVDRTIPVARL